MNLAFILLRVGRYALVLALVTVLTGCGTVKLPSAEQVRAFKQAGPVRAELDRDQLTRARMPAGPYRVVVGDVLRLQLPAITRTATSEISPQTLFHLTRVTQDGTISLPIVGAIPAVGRTLAHIEQDVVAAYYPKYVKNLPSVVATVAEYHTVAVAIVGAVVSPGLYRLNSEERSVVALVMKAGGIAQDGAGRIRIRRPDSGEQAEPLVLPVKGLNIPFADVVLTGGETVEVDRLEPRLFMVTGLVKRPGPFPYPEEASYDLSQALAFAGGVDESIDPRYAKVYRQDADGQIVSCAFKLSAKGEVHTSGLQIKPGDIVAVEHTQRTRTRQALASMFRISTGMVVGATYDLNPED